MHLMLISIKQNSAQQETSDDTPGVSSLSLPPNPTDVVQPQSLPNQLTPFIDNSVLLSPNL